MIVMNAVGPEVAVVRIEPALVTGLLAFTPALAWAQACDGAPRVGQAWSTSRTGQTTRVGQGWSTSRTGRTTGVGRAWTTGRTTCPTTRRGTGRTTVTTRSRTGRTPTVTTRSRTGRTTVTTRWRTGRTPSATIRWSAGRTATTARRSPGRTRVPRAWDTGRRTRTTGRGAPRTGRTTTPCRTTPAQGTRVVVVTDSGARYVSAPTGRRVWIDTGDARPYLDRYESVGPAGRSAAAPADGQLRPAPGPLAASIVAALQADDLERACRLATWAERVPDMEAALQAAIFARFPSPALLADVTASLEAGSGCAGDAGCASLLRLLGTAPPRPDGS